MGQTYAIPPEHALALKQVFEEDARTLPRILAGCSFEWRPGVIESTRSLFRTYKELIISEIKNAAALDAKDQSQQPGGPPPPKPGAGWQSASPQSGQPGRPGMMGGHRSNPPVPPKPQTGWQSAIPSRAGGRTTIGAHRVPPGLKERLEQLKTSAGKSTLVDAKALIGEGMSVAIDQAKDAISDAVKDALGFDLEAVFADIVGDAAAEVAFEVAAAIPFVGAALGIAKNFSASAASSFQALLKQLSIRTVKKTSEHFTPGNPREALNGIKALLERKRNHALYRAATEGAHGVARGVALAGDIGALGMTGGAVSSAVGIAGGLVKAAANLAEAIVRAIQDAQEMITGNKLLLYPSQIKVPELVEHCPLLCCYLITEASPSALIGFLSEGTLSYNWMGEVEELMPKIREIQRIANVIEREAPYRLKASRRYYGEDAATRLKSNAFLSERLRDLPAQVMHDLRHRLRKDPRSLPAATRFWFEKVTATMRQGPTTV